MPVPDRRERAERFRHVCPGRDGMLARAVMTENGPKSAYELAMERLRKKDAESGVVAGPVSDAQKAGIAEVRQVAEARLAELKILHQSALAGTFDPTVREALEAEYRRDVQRVTDDRERKIAKIRERPA
jgi:hypothetical protein